MPSGSHRGSSGSHRSGGSSFSGSRSSSRSSSSSGSSWSSSSSRRSGGSHRSSSWGSSHGSSGGWSFSWGHSRPRAPRRHSGPVFIFGGRMRVSGGVGLCLTLCFIALFFAFFFIVGAQGNIADCNTMLRKIETDYTYYQNMIKKAEANPSTLIRKGTITDVFYNEECDRWYFTYELDLSSGYGKLEGYTFSTYTDATINDFNVNQQIDIAVNSYPVTRTTDSIPVVYKYTTLEDDGEYLEAKSDIGTFNAMKIIGIVLAVAAPVGIIATIIYSIKKTKATNAGDELETPSTIAPQKEVRRCMYCGTSLGSNRNSCPGCGSSLN